MIDLTRIKELLGSHWLAVQEGIRAYLGTDISLLNSVNENLLSSGGKQVRPMLSLLVAGACSGGRINEDSVRLAIAAELLHNATLLHDDVADEADQRRGKPTVRKMLGPQASVLIGDFWLVRAVQAVMDVQKDHDRAVALFAATLADLAEGEMFQLQKASSCDTVMEDYLRIVYGKTASLFVTSCVTAALSVTAGEQVEKAVAEYGRYLGYAFQMRDDIFDYEGSDSVGKPTGIDVLEQKITLPLLCAMDAVDASRADSLRIMVREISPEKRDAIVAFVKENGGIEAAQRTLESYSQKAVRALDVLEESEYKKALVNLAEYLAKRES